MSNAIARIRLIINNDEHPRWLDERILAIPAASL